MKTIKVGARQLAALVREASVRRQPVLSVGAARRRRMPVPREQMLDAVRQLEDLMRKLSDFVQMHSDPRVGRAYEEAQTALRETRGEINALYNLV